MDESSIKKLIVGVATLGVLTLLGVGSCETVEEGYQGVYLVMGKAKDQALGPGLHSKIPLFSTVKKMDIRQQKFEQQTGGSSKDEQTVSTKVAVNYKLGQDQAVKIYSSLGRDKHTWENVVLAPAIEERTKAVTAKFKAVELITKREEVKDLITSGLVERLKAEGFTVTQVSITDFTFSQAYQKSIEEKQVAEQAAQRAKNELEQHRTNELKMVATAEAELKAAEMDAQARIVKAKAAAEEVEIAAEAKAKAIDVLTRAEADRHRKISGAASKNSLEYQRIKKWDGKTPETVLSSNTGVVLP